MDERAHVRAWLEAEHDYQMQKFSVELDDQRDFEHWESNIVRYFHRARLLGLDNPNGRQAFAKGVSTARDALESIVRVHGPLPEPGHTSGEIVEWTDAP